MKHYVFFLSVLFVISQPAVAQFNIPVYWTGGGGGSNTEVCNPNHLTLTADPIPPGLTYRWLEYPGYCAPGMPPTVLLYGTSQIVFGETAQIVCQAVDSFNQVQGESSLIPVISPDFNGGICDENFSTNPSTICQGDSIWLQCNQYDPWSIAIFNSSPGDTVLQWQLNGIDIPGTVNDLYYYASATGSYRLKFRLSCGTGYSNIKQVTVIPTPVPSITGINVICNGSSTTLCANAGFACYMWSNGANTQCVTATVTGTYFVTVCDAFGCTGSATITLTVNPNPVPVITGNDTICLGATATLCANGGYACYLWSTGSTTQCLNAGAAGNYTVTVCDVNGCTGTASTILTVNPTPTPQITGDSTLCPGQSTVLDAGSGWMNYIWSNGATTQTIPINVITTITVTVTNAYGCTGSDNITLIAAPPYATVLSASGPLGICQGDSVQLTAPSPMSSYQWYKNNILIPGATASTLWVSTTGSYKCLSTDLQNCPAVSNQLRVRIVCFPPIDPGERVTGTSNPYSVYPNPSTSDFYISTTEGFSGKEIVQVFDMTGRSIVFEKFENEDGIRLSIPGSGLFFIRISDGINNWQTLVSRTGN